MPISGRRPAARIFLTGKLKLTSRFRFSCVVRKLMRRNFSSRARELSGGDAIIISIPKSGRTWVRTFLCAYFCKRAGRDFTLEPERYGDPAIPRLIYSHDWFEHHTKGSNWDRLRGKYLVPARELRRAKVILLARDPRDCFVSFYVQITRRDPGSPVELKQKAIGELLRDGKFGVQVMVATMNNWISEFAGRDDFTIVRYESLRASPFENFRALLVAIGETSPNMTIFQDALEFSRFENMQKLETAGAFDSKILRPGDVDDPESFKVRRGKIGGYEEYLSAEDRHYAGEVLRKLDPRFGYNP